MPPPPPPPSGGETGRQGKTKGENEMDVHYTEEESKLMSVISLDYAMVSSDFDELFDDFNPEVFDGLGRTLNSMYYLHRDMVMAAQREEKIDKIFCKSMIEENRNIFEDIMAKMIDRTNVFNQRIMRNQNDEYDYDLIELFEIATDSYGIKSTASLQLTGYKKH